MAWLLPGALALLAVNAQFKAPARWRWQLRLLTLEFGHWLAVVCLCIAPWCWWVLGLVPVFLLPALQAANIAKKRGLAFSWLRLWFPRRKGRTVRVERRCFWREGEDQLDVVIYTPPGDGRSRTCVVALHTGGWDSGDAGEFVAANREIAASSDVVVCSIGYRLAPKHCWPTQREDVQRGIDWVRSNSNELGIDAEKIILLGRSAGAQIAAACAFGLPELRMAGCIAVYGPPDMFFARKWSYPDDILKSLKLVQQYMGGDPEALAEAYRTASATEFISEQSPRTLLIHGGSDSMVWVEHSRRMSKLMSGKSPCDYLELPWGDHGCDFFPSSPGGQLSLLAIQDFLRSTK